MGVNDTEIDKITRVYVVKGCANQKISEVFPAREEARAPHEHCEQKAIREQADYYGVPFISYRRGTEKNGFIIQQMPVGSEGDVFTFDTTRWKQELRFATEGYGKIARALEKRAGKKGITILLGR